MAFLVVSLLQVTAQTTIVSYQGALSESGAPSEGAHEFEFELFDADTGGTSVAGPLTRSSVDVAGGLFNTELDFGAAVFDGSDRWLEIRVRPQGSTDAFIVLDPRQPVRSSPYAIRALAAGSAISASTADLANTATSATSVVAGGVDAAAIQDESVGSGAVMDGSLAPVDFDLGSFDLTFWKMNGNSGTTAGTHFLGNSDSQPLELMVNGQRALRIENTVGTPNLIGGYSGNGAGPDSIGAAIGGGGAFETENTMGANSEYGVIDGGINNFLSASRRASVIGGGENNTVTGTHSIVAGGVANYNAGWGASIGGGNANRIWANDATIGGGVGNEIHPNSRYSTVSGGVFNKVFGQSVIAVIGGGQENTIGIESSRSTIAGGFQNAISDRSWGSTIAGGWSHGINSNSIYSTISGGEQNGIGTNSPDAPLHVEGGTDTSVSGGGYLVLGNKSGENISIDNNEISARNNNGSDTLYLNVDSGPVAIGTGSAGTDYKVRVNGGSAGGAYILAAASGTSPAVLRVQSSTGNGVALHATQGSTDATAVFGNSGSGNLIRGFSGPGAGNLVFYVDNEGDVYANTYNLTSDRDRKENFSDVDSQSVLQKVIDLPISQWNYKSDADTPHMGPMAQDFYAAFGVGPDDKHISTVDVDGVALAAIQGLNRKLEDKLEQKNTEIAEILEMNLRLTERLAALERLMGSRYAVGSSQ